MRVRSEPKTIGNETLSSSPKLQGQRTESRELTDTSTDSANAATTAQIATSGLSPSVELGSGTRGTGSNGRAKERSCNDGCGDRAHDGVREYCQKYVAAIQPIATAPRKPASDFLGANMDGSAGVYRPSVRPTVLAAVSTQDNMTIESTPLRM